MELNFSEEEIQKILMCSSQEDLTEKLGYNWTHWLAIRKDENGYTLISKPIVKEMKK